MIPLLLLLAAPASGQSAPAAEQRGKAFWKELASACAVPAGESAFGLVQEAVSLLGSPDSEWRDDVGYGVVAICVYRKKLLSAPADHARLLEAVWSKLTAPATPVFTHAEDERLAAALAALARRADFEAASLDAWLARFTSLEQQVWAKSPPETATLDAAQNARNLLRSLYVLVSLPQPAPTDGQLAAREKLLATLQAIRR